MLPRIIKAAIKALIYFVFLYALPVFLISQVSQFAPELFADYVRLLNLFIAVVIVFVVASELTAGTILQHAFNIGKAIILIIFLVLALDGGILNLSLNFEGMHLNLWADLRIYLAMLIFIDLIVLSKSVLQAINFLAEKAEQQLPTPKPAG